MRIDHEWIKVVDAGEYLNFQCRRCNTSLRVRYLGLDSGEPSFQFACERCHTEETCKMKGALWSGLPAKAA